MPMGTDGWYALLGYHMATVTTAETLPNSSYGNEDIYGYQIGLGRRVENAKVEIDFFFTFVFLNKKGVCLLFVSKNIKI